MERGIFVKGNKIFLFLINRSEILRLAKELFVRDYILKRKRYFDSKKMIIVKFFYMLKDLFNLNTIKEIKILSKQKVVLPILEIPITVRCTLNCEQCANLMPYYHNNKEKLRDVSIKELSREVEKLFECVDSICRLSLIGGEPFMHKDLIHIIDMLLDSKKILWIHITTNGTIVPSDDFFRGIKDKPVSIKISNYGILAKNRELVIQKIKEFEIPFFMEEESLTWFEYGNVTLYNRSEAEYIAQYRNCLLPVRCFYKGKLHVCPRSSHGMDLGIIPDNKEDYIDLFEPNISKKTFKEKLEIIERKKYVESCKYCKMGLKDGLKVPSAIQLEK